MYIWYIYISESGLCYCTNDRSTGIIFPRLCLGCDTRTTFPRATFGLTLRAGAGPTVIRCSPLIVTGPGRATSGSPRYTPSNPLCGVGSLRYEINHSSQGVLLRFFSSSPGRGRRRMVGLPPVIIPGLPTVGLATMGLPTRAISGLPTSGLPTRAIPGLATVGLFGTVTVGLVTRRISGLPMVGLGGDGYRRYTGYCGAADRWWYQRWPGNRECRARYTRARHPGR